MQIIDTDVVVATWYFIGKDHGVIFEVEIVAMGALGEDRGLSYQFAQTGKCSVRHLDFAPCALLLLFHFTL